MQLIASRIKVLQAQDDVVNAMKDSASKELLHVADYKNAYKKLLKSLIVQSLLRLKEPSVLLRCNEVDVGLSEFVLADAKQEYAEKAKVNAPEVTIDNLSSAYWFGKWGCGFDFGLIIGMVHELFLNDFHFFFFYQLIENQDVSVVDSFTVSSNGGFPYFGVIFRIGKWS
ncbi:hypothetical protein F0562_017807 [Nyssa sinensis]|uniref:V-type proton ATPase subunit E n=1 Tax=Nyssa sinensis TaxID=561372 RepID=A0A5J4ZFX5_9ASTE|nr:hypothetical protein F0562_017807 [Nyssa sinensis]